MLDQDSRKEKTKMDFMFIHNGKRFEYGFTADNNFIYEREKMKSHLIPK